MREDIIIKNRRNIKGLDNWDDSKTRVVYCSTDIDRWQFEDMINAFNKTINIPKYNKINPKRNNDAVRDGSAFYISKNVLDEAVNSGKFQRFSNTVETSEKSTNLWYVPNDYDFCILLTNGCCGYLFDKYIEVDGQKQAVYDIFRYKGIHTTSYMKINLTLQHKIPMTDKLEAKGYQPVKLLYSIKADNKPYVAKPKDHHRHEIELNEQVADSVCHHKYLEFDNRLKSTVLLNNREEHRRWHLADKYRGCHQRFVYILDGAGLITFMQDMDNTRFSSIYPEEKVS